MKKTIIAILFLLLLSAQVGLCAMPQPQGVGGRVFVNGLATNGITVIVKNNNTGEQSTIITRTSDAGQAGFYAVAFSAMKNDVIVITTIYNSLLYKNSAVIIDFVPTLWLNLSIMDNGGQNPPPSPPIGQNHPPQANFSYSPLQPVGNQTVIFRDNSMDIDRDIVSWTWTINQQTFTGKFVAYAFIHPGPYLATLVVLDINNSVSIAQKTIIVSPSNQPSQQGNQTMNLTIHFQVKDKWNVSIPGATVQIYYGGTLLTIEQTNESGIVATILPPGTYRIKISYGTMETTGVYTFNGDQNVVFLLTSNPIIKGSDNTILYLLIAIGIIISVSIIIVVMWVKRWI